MKKNTTIIKAKRSWLDLELVDFLEYKDLLFLLIRRDFVTSYKQTLLGPIWVVAQALLGSAIFTVIFSKVANISTDGHPAFLFYLSGMLGWQYFASVYGVGCNALHRDFTPDVICAVDHGVMHEIYHSGICNHIQGYFRDWTKIPEKMYKMVVEGNVSSKDIDLIRKEGVLTENNKGLSKEFVFHGSKLEGVAHIIKKNKEVIEKNISTGQIKVSWIHPTKDRTTSLTDIMNGKDKGWATGPSSGYVACHLGATEVFLVGHDLQSTKPTVNKKIRKVNPKATPRICGNVFFIPKLKPE